MDGLPVEDICQLLNKRCPSYFSEPDRLRFKALELLQYASSIQSRTERTLFLEESLEIFQKVPSQLNLEELGKICLEYKRLYFYQGVVKLVLDYAKAIDPTNSGFVWHLTDPNPQDTHGLRFFEARKSAYTFILEVFDEILSSETPNQNQDRPEIEPEVYSQLRKQTFLAVKASDDELFHNYLYHWFLERELESELLDTPWPFLEKVLLTLF